MITFALVCLGFLAVLAIVVPIVDTASSSRLRIAATERRQRWEARRRARPA